jgi:hypothetical protein
LIRHLEIDEAFQGINLTEFHFLNDTPLPDRQLVDSFIHSKHFTSDCIRDIIKNNTENQPFLRQAFENSIITSNDFKKLTKSEIITFFDDFGNQEDWGDTDIYDFITLKK